MRDRVNLDYVKLSSEQFIRKFEKKTGQKVPGVLFNKYMTLLHRNLKEMGHDIGLPHCWYRWGDEVVRYNMPYIGWNHECASQTQVFWCGEKLKPIRNPDEILKYASEYADEFIEKYSGKEGVELAIDETYDRAPFRFQNDYRILRESLKNIKKNMTSMFSNTKNVAEPLFKTAMENFPEEFGDVVKEKDLFESMFDVMLDSAQIYDVFNIVEDF